MRETKEEISSNKETKKCTVELTEYAIQDLQILPDEVLDEVEEYLDEIENNPRLGRPLYDRKDCKLKGCRKVYIGNRVYRIVYQLIKNKVYVTEIGEIPEEVTDIARVIAVGVRENKDVYHKAYQRLALTKDTTPDSD